MSNRRSFLQYVLFVRNLPDSTNSIRLDPLILKISKDFGKSRSSEGGSRKVSSSTTGAYGSGGTAESLLKGGSGKKATKTPPPPTPPKDKKQKTKASGRQSELSQTSLGKKGKQKKN